MKKRMEYIDIVRGICIILMIAGHIGFQSEGFDHYIHAFHMPIFFIISGYFYKKNEKTIIDIASNLSKKLLIPYFFWALIALVIENYTTIGRHRGVMNGIKTIFTANNDVIQLAGALWFLTAFLFTNIIFVILEKKIKNKKVFYLLTSIIMLLGIYLDKVFKINLWWSINPGLVGVGFMTIGHILKEYNLLEKYTDFGFIIGIILLIINTLSIMNTSYVNMRINVYPNIILFLFKVILSFYLLVWISKKLYQIKIINPINKGVQLLGKESIVSLCINQILILLLNSYLYTFLLKVFKTTPCFILQLVILVVTLGIILIIIKIIQKSKIKIIFGK